MCILFFFAMMGLVWLFFLPVNVSDWRNERRRGSRRLWSTCWSRALDFGHQRTRIFSQCRAWNSDTTPTLCRCRHGGGRLKEFFPKFKFVHYLCVHISVRVFKLVLIYECVLNDKILGIFNLPVGFSVSYGVNW